MPASASNGCRPAGHRRVSRQSVSQLCGTDAEVEDSGEWRKAFLACRKHRIDLTVLVEHDRVAFLRGLPAFVEQVEDVDYLNLFLTSVGCVARSLLHPIQAD